jgi:amidase
VGELHDLTALEQGQAVRAGELSPVELARHYLERTDRLGAAVGAFTTVTADLALVAAGAAEKRVRDAAEGEDLGPLFGVVVPVKDLTQVAGVRTTFGSRAYEDFVGALDDHVVTLLRTAGTVLTGLTTAPEFGLPCYTEPDVAPPARTPYDLSRTAGGSSGGAAAAVAAGLAPVALGNDGGGSVRIPASACGLVGLKTSRGRISNGPVGGDVAGLACHGPLARTVADAAALLDILAVPMPGDPHWAPPLPPGETFLGWAGRDPGRCRVARFAVPVIAEVGVHPECLRAYEDAAALLAELGHEVIDVDPPAGPEAAADFELVWTTLAASAPVPPGREELLQPLTRYLRERGRAVGGPQFAGAVAGMRNLARRVLTAWEPYDAVLTPTLAAPPVPIGALRDDADPAAGFAAQKAFTPWTALYNVTGQPAVSLPLHRTAGTPDAPGLPVGVMLAGRPAGEGPLLALAAQLERARPWSDWRPPCW